MRIIPTLTRINLHIFHLAAHGLKLLRDIFNRSKSCGVLQVLRLCKLHLIDVWVKFGNLHIVDIDSRILSLGLAHCVLEEQRTWSAAGRHRTLGVAIELHQSSSLNHVLMTEISIVLKRALLNWSDLPLLCFEEMESLLRSRICIVIVSTMKLLAILNLLAVVGGLLLKHGALLADWRAGVKKAVPAHWKVLCLFYILNGLFLWLEWIDLDCLI